jgi:hypothetical protein
VGLANGRFGAKRAVLAMSYLIASAIASAFPPEEGLEPGFPSGEPPSH